MSASLALNEIKAFLNDAKKNVGAQTQGSLV